MKQIDRTSVFMPRECKAAIVIVHGMQEHRHRYEALGEYLAQNGIGTLAYDLPGHGKSLPHEELGWFGEDGWDNLVESAVHEIKAARQIFDNVPVFFLGHSMGAMIGRCFLQEHDALIDGMILSGPPCFNKSAGVGKAVASMVKKAKGDRGFSTVLDNLATGSFNKAIENPRTSLDWLSYNEENVDAYIADEYCGFPFTVKGYEDLLEGMLRMHDPRRFHVTAPDLPLYAFAGQDDPCIGGEEGFNATVRFLLKVGYQCVKNKLYPGMRHETMHETGREKVFGDICGWICAQLTKTYK